VVTRHQVRDGSGENIGAFFFDESGPLVTRWLPLTSSAVMTLLGMSIAVQALASGLVPWKLT